MTILLFILYSNTYIKTQQKNVYFIVVIQSVKVLALLLGTFTLYIMGNHVYLHHARWKRTNCVFKAVSLKIFLYLYLEPQSKFLDDLHV